LPAVEPGILPGGPGFAFGNTPPISRVGSGRQDAALYGNQDGCRHVWTAAPVIKEFFNGL